MVDDLLRRHRKYTLTWFVLLSSLCLLLWGKLTGDLYVNLTIFTLGLYFGSNVSEKATEAWRDRKP